MTGDVEGHWTAPLSVPHCFVHVLCCRGFSYMYILLLLNKSNLKKPTMELVFSDQVEFKELVNRRREGSVWKNMGQWGVLIPVRFTPHFGWAESRSLMQFLVWAAACFLSAFDLRLVNVSNPFHFWRDLRSCSCYSPPVHIPFFNTILFCTILLYRNANHLVTCCPRQLAKHCQGNSPTKQF